MTKCAELLFPCCYSENAKGGNEKESCTTSHHAHGWISLVSAIIVGTGSALAVYFATLGIIVWTAVTGVSAALVTGISLYIILRCAFGITAKNKVPEPPRPPPPPPVKNVLPPKKKDPTPLKKRPPPPPPKKEKSEKSEDSIRPDNRDWSHFVIEQVLTYPGPVPHQQKAEMQTEQKGSYYHIYFKDRSFNVTIRQEDLLDSRAQVIVNAANNGLGGGGGIDGWIHEKGGKDYETEHQTHLRNHYNGYFTSGYAAMIGSGDLSKEERKDKKIDKVIVVAGPIAPRSDDKDIALYFCYFNACRLASKHGMTSIAFPSISTGIFHYPKDIAAEISLRAFYDFITQNPTTTLKTISLHYKYAHEGVLESYQNLGLPQKKTN